MCVPAYMCQDRLTIRNEALLIIKQGVLSTAGGRLEIGDPR